MGMAPYRFPDTVRVSRRQKGRCLPFSESVPWNCRSGTVSLARVAGTPARAQGTNAATQHTRRGKFVLFGRGCGQHKKQGSGEEPSGCREPQPDSEVAVRTDLMWAVEEFVR